MKNSKNGGLRVLTAEELVKQRPEMYWGTPAPESSDVVNALVEQMKILGAVTSTVLEYEDWILIASKKDWIRSALNNGRSVKDIFYKSCAFPEAGGLSLRCEFFLTVFATDVFLWRDNDLSIIKGKPLPMLNNIVKQRFADEIVVGFRGNTYKKNQNNDE